MVKLEISACSADFKFYHGVLSSSDRESLFDTISLGIREFLRPYAISLFSYLLALVTGSSTAVNDRIFDCHELAMCFLSVLATYDKKIIGQRY